MTGSTEGSITAPEFLEQQSLLEKEALELMPFDPQRCTFTDGALRQQLYACLTCLKNQPKSEGEKPVFSGVCYSCSIQCHSTHELVELFTKRHFTCDCGTTRMLYNGGCRLRNVDPKSPADDIPSSSNRYSNNFEGTFCSCEQPYNPLEETGNMFQCFFGEVCNEDWFHEECLMGIPRGSVERKAKHTLTRNGKNILETLPEIEVDEDAATKTEENDSGEEDAAPLPGFPSANDFDCLICWKCVDKFKALDLIPRSVRLPDIFHVESKSLDDRATQLKNYKETQSNSKRLKTTTSKDFKFSIFLKDGFQSALKSIISTNEKHYDPLISLLRQFPFLYEEDPVYEPPEESLHSETESSSMFDLGTKALESLPREQAIEGLQAYEKVKQKLSQFLRPFAQEGRIVTKEEIKRFFEDTE